MILFKQMIVLFLVMLLGFCLARKGVLDDFTGKKLSWLVVNICNPALALSGSLGEELIPPSRLGQTLLVALTMYVLLLVLAQVLPSLLRVRGTARNTYSIMTVFSNLGFMGFPILSAMYGSGALLYAAIFSILYNLLIYTYGVGKIRGNFSWKELGKVLNVGVIASLTAIGIYGLRLATGFVVPDFLSQTVTLLSGMTAPLSMMVIGASMAGMSFRELFGDGKLLVFAGLRLILIPFLFLLFLKRFLTDPMMLGVCLVMSATPVGSMTAMLSQQYGGDVKTSSKGVALTTIFSVGTLPLLFALLGL